MAKKNEKKAAVKLVDDVIAVVPKIAKDAKNYAKNIGEKGVEYAREKADEIKNAANEVKIKRDKRIYCPVVKEDFDSLNFELPKLVYILDSDPHKDLEACKDAMGYCPKVAKSKIFELVRKNIKNTGINFYPNNNGEIFYKNPYIENLYINLDDYFNYIKKERINELEFVANKLGAKHVKIVIKEEKKRFVTGKASKTRNVEYDGNGTRKSINADYSNKKLEQIEIAKDSYFEGSDSYEIPKLVYYKGDSDIEGLIKMRKGKNPPKTKTYTLKYNRSSDINLSVASDIDSVLKELKLNAGASASIKGEVERENRMYFEYTIEF